MTLFAADDTAWTPLFQAVTTMFCAYLTFKVTIISRQTDGISSKLAAAEKAKGVIEGGDAERREQGRPPLPAEKPQPCDPMLPKNGPQL